MDIYCWYGDKKESKEAIRLRKQGVNLESIAKQLGLSKSRIYEYLRGTSKKQNWNSRK